MSAQGVRPERIGEFGVAHGNVAADAFDVAFAVPVAKGGGHVLELPLALGGEVWVGGDAAEDDVAVGHCLKGGFVFEFMAVGGFGTGGDGEGAALGLDGGG